MTQIQELNGDQSRETINTSQRFAAYLQAKARDKGFRGSMSFASRSGAEYLLRDYYDPRSGVRRQKSLGRRNAETEAIYQAFVDGKSDAADRRRAAADVMDRQASVNRALRLGRVPEIGARIVRALDDAGLLGHGLKIVGTNAVYAYEAAAGVHVSSDITTTEDIDMLFDARAQLRIEMNENVKERSLLSVLRHADRSFERTNRTFQAVNRDGYLVDLIKPERNPPWTVEADSISGASLDLQASPIAGLQWHESAPAFEAVAIDSRGYPLTIAAPDPRAFAVHKFWLSSQPDRSPAKRRRDMEQARVVALITTRYLKHLPFAFDALRSFPKALVEAAKPLFDDVNQVAG